MLPRDPGVDRRLVEAALRLEQPIAEGERRVVATWFVPGKIRLEDRLLQVSGRLGGKRLPAELVLRVEIADGETGEVSKRYRMILDRSLEDGFRKSKKFPGSVAAGSFVTVTVEPLGEKLASGTEITVCVDAVAKRNELARFRSCAVGDAAATLVTIQRSILSGRCATSGCHDAVTAEEGLVLESGRSFGELVGVRSNESPSELRVRPGDPGRSYLVKKLRGSASIGGRMPLGGPFLSDEEIAGVVEWIQNGAADD